jgi:hypothetical protein
MRSWRARTAAGSSFGGGRATEPGSVECSGPTACRLGGCFDGINYALRGRREDDPHGGALGIGVDEQVAAPATHAVTQRRQPRSGRTAIEEHALQHVASQIRTRERSVVADLEHDGALGFEDVHLDLAIRSPRAAKRGEGARDQRDQEHDDRGARHRREAAAGRLRAHPRYALGLSREEGHDVASELTAIGPRGGVRRSEITEDGDDLASALERRAEPLEHVA